MFLPFGREKEDEVVEGGAEKEESQKKVGAEKRKREEDEEGNAEEGEEQGSGNDLELRLPYSRVGPRLPCFSFVFLFVSDVL